MLSVVCWKWEVPGYHTRFTHEHVNTLYSMVNRHLHCPHEFVCFTDNVEGLDPGIRALPVPTSLANVPNPMGAGFPSCYRRLFAFAPEFVKIIPNRFVSVDLDCVIVDDVTPLWDVHEDVKFWLHARRTPMYNGSMWMHTPGTHPEVWLDFDPETSPKEAVIDNFRGSDQGWMSKMLPESPVWEVEDGVYNWNTHLRNRNYRLPSDARIVFFCGLENPWDERVQKQAGWIRDHYK